MYYQWGVGGLLFFYLEWILTYRRRPPKYNHQSLKLHNGTCSFCIVFQNQMWPWSKTFYIEILFENLYSEGSKKSRYWENHLHIEFLEMHISNKKKFWYIYRGKFTKCLQGRWSLLNILMVFGTKSIILTNTMHLGNCNKYTLAK